MPRKKISDKAPPRLLYELVNFVRHPATARFVPLVAPGGGTIADSFASSVTTSPGTNVGITIPSGQKFYMTDLTVTNRASATTLVTVTDGSGGAVKETVDVAAGATAKLAYVTPKQFSTAVFAFAGGGATDVSVSGQLA